MKSCKFMTSPNHDKNNITIFVTQYALSEKAISIMVVKFYATKNRHLAPLYIYQDHRVAGKISSKSIS